MLQCFPGSTLINRGRESAWDAQHLKPSLRGERASKALAAKFTVFGAYPPRQCVAELGASGPPGMMLLGVKSPIRTFGLHPVLPRSQKYHWAMAHQNRIFPNVYFVHTIYLSSGYALHLLCHIPKFRFPHRIESCSLSVGANIDANKMLTHSIQESYLILPAEGQSQPQSGKRAREEGHNHTGDHHMDDDQDAQSVGNMPDTVLTGGSDQQRQTDTPGYSLADEINSLLDNHDDLLDEEERAQQMELTPTQFAAVTVVVTGLQLYPRKHRNEMAAAIKGLEHAVEHTLGKYITANNLNDTVLRPTFTHPSLEHASLTELNGYLHLSNHVCTRLAALPTGLTLHTEGVQATHRKVLGLSDEQQPCLHITKAHGHSTDYSITISLAAVSKPHSSSRILHQPADAARMATDHLLALTLLPLLLFCCSFVAIKEFAKKLMNSRLKLSDIIQLQTILELLPPTAESVLRRLPESLHIKPLMRCLAIVITKREMLSVKAAPVILPDQLAELRHAAYQNGSLSLFFTLTVEDSAHEGTTLPSYSFFKDVLFHLDWDSSLNPFPSQSVLAAVTAALRPVNATNTTGPVFLVSVYPNVGCRAHGPKTTPKGHLELRCNSAINQVYTQHICCSQGHLITSLLALYCAENLLTFDLNIAILPFVTTVGVLLPTYRSTRQSRLGRSWRRIPPRTISGSWPKPSPQALQLLRPRLSSAASA